jgi:S1-C subfamily serine protease
MLCCPAGILVLSAREGGPAWKSGIRGTSRDEYGRLVLGDIITAINGKSLRNSSDLYRVLDKARVSTALGFGWSGLKSGWCRGVRMGF